MAHFADIYPPTGATLRGGAWGVQERTAALQMALVADRLPGGEG